jgi:hypothetical protein
VTNLTTFFPFALALDTSASRLGAVTVKHVLADQC